VYELNPGVPESDQHLETVVISDNVRANIMSYWRCNPLGQVFSHDQVTKMRAMLDDPTRSSKWTQRKLKFKPTPPPGEGPPKSPLVFRFDPISPRELFNIAKKLEKENPEAYALQFEPKHSLPRCGVRRTPLRR
jgi:hypothetical protein